MGPARLELFRFSLYVFFPIAIMLHYGDPDWYEKYVKPFRESYTLSQVPQMEPPKDRSELQEQLAKLRDERLGRRQRQASTQAPAGQSLPLMNGKELLSDVARTARTGSAAQNTSTTSFGTRREI